MGAEAVDAEELARAEEPVRDIYKRYAGQEVYEVVSK